MELVMLLMLKAVTLQVTARKELKLVLPNRSWGKKKNRRERLHLFSHFTCQPSGFS